MKVALDISQMHNLSLTRGIGVYAQNLYKSIKEFTDTDIELIEKKEDLHKFDLIHFPFFDLFKKTLPFNLPKPVVVTIHDLIPLQFPNHYPPGIKGKINWQLQKLALKNIDQIIAVSETVKKDIETILKINPSKIKVVYSAPSDSFRKITDKKTLEALKTKYKLPDEFVLYVGNINWNKNILNTTEAVLSAGKNLVIIGAAFLDKNNINHPEKKSFKTWLEKYENNENIKIIGFTQTEEIAGIMSLAECLIFASFYEGFGIPVLEAQSCELPVITSKISATAEIAGKGAILVDPENVTDITGSVKRVTQNPDFRKQLIKAGNENLKRFSWKETALKTVQLYEEVFTK